MDRLVDFCIVGAGIAGLTLARELGGEGRKVVVLDRASPGHGATWAAAGMLAPLVEARLEERPLMEFGRQALEAYRQYLDDIAEETGIDCGYRDDGVLIVAVDRDHLALLRHAFQEQHDMGLPVEWASGYDLREREPYLAPGVPGGIMSRSDHQVDNRRLVAALLEALRLREVEVIGEAGDIAIERGDDGTLRCLCNGMSIVAGSVVVATGAWNDLLATVDRDLAGALRPVKGQILRLDQRSFHVLDHVLRTPDVYLAPKSDGTIVLGASSEDKGFDATVTAGEIYELLRRARLCLPVVMELPILETRVGFRPATVDHLPLIGPTAASGVYIAGGYYRHGILFAPMVARILADTLLHGRSSLWLETFSPHRFHEAAA